ncbi:unnamed protein product [Cochlearia groenlandica]
MDHKDDHTFLYVSSNPSSSSSSSSIDNSFDLINHPTILYTINLISIILFVFCMFHLLFRFLRRHQILLDDVYDEENAIALNGQIQTIINHQNSGVDQSLINALPLFHYKTMIIGLGHDLSDCAVCLYEFKPEDELRLLPKCSHAFHVGCIDTWLQTNSTCPLCRNDLLLVLESHGESSQESDSLLVSKR